MLVVGTSLSSRDDLVVTRAADWARALGLGLAVVHAVHPTQVTSGELGTGWVDGSRQAQVEARTSRELVERLRQLGVETERTTTRTGRVHRVLAEEAQRADLVVVGSSVGEQMVVGSAADRVVRSARCPVLLLREGAIPPRHWLVGVDLSVAALDALREAVRLAARVGPPEHFDLLLAIDESVLRPGESRPWSEIESMARARLEEASSDIALPDSASLLIGRGRPADLLVQRAADSPVDLVVVGSHGLGGFDRGLIGPVAREVSARSSVSTLVVPPIPA